MPGRMASAGGFSLERQVHAIDSSLCLLRSRWTNADFVPGTVITMAWATWKRCRSFHRAGAPPAPGAPHGTSSRGCTLQAALALGLCRPTPTLTLTHAGTHTIYPLVGPCDSQRLAFTFPGTCRVWSLTDSNLFSCLGRTFLFILRTCALHHGTAVQLTNSRGRRCTPCAALH